MTQAVLNFNPPAKTKRPVKLPDFGPGSEYPEKASDIEKLWWLLSRHEGFANKIGAKKIAETFGWAWHEGTRRHITVQVEELKCTYRKRIGGTRLDGGGYCLCVSLADRLRAARQYMRQASTEFATAKLFLDPKEMSELRGQERLLLDISL